MAGEPLLLEYEVKLTSFEVDLILLDTHAHLAAALAYLDQRQRFLSSSGPETWLRLRINRLRNLAAKLEALKIS